MLAEIPTPQYRAALDRCAADALWEARIDRPPVNAFRLAERLGMVVAQDNLQSSRARVVTLGEPIDGSRDAILVAEEPRSERRHWAIAHEVGETQAYRVFEALGVDPIDAPPTAREEIANALAGRILLPIRWFRGVWRDADGDLPEVKRVFQTASHELIVRRALECVRTPMIVTVTDQGGPTWRRWNLFGPTPPLMRLEADCQRHAHEFNEPAWGDGRSEPGDLGGAPVERVRCWPIHEEGWRREITLTELRGDEPEWL